MLISARKVGDKIKIGDDVAIVIKQIKRSDTIVLGIEVPKEKRVVLESQRSTKIKD